ncbi:increased rDNA silencing protein 4 [Scheffersomyces xylosifermentans]|uniref:increased rDNA silencing protein 4 n=1 Tax=Scheffersomyces xylosifermentans TaxID=1304137 RepID=UPI00315C6B6B
MSEKSTASQAAALAAFKGLASKKDPPPHKNKPNLSGPYKLPVSLDNPKTRSSSSIASPASVPNRSKIVRNVSNSQIAKPRTRNASSNAIKASANGQVSSSQASIKSPPKTPRALMSPEEAPRVRTTAEIAASESIRDANATRTRPRSFVGSTASLNNDTESIVSAIDYFSLPKESKRTPVKSMSQSQQASKEMINSVKQSIESKAIVNDPTQKRISNIYEPKEMLKNLRQSINSKAVSGSSNTTLSSKNQAMLSGIRDRIESQRISTNLSNASPSSDEKGTIRARSLEKPLYELADFNNSLSSVGSSFSENEIAPAPSPTNLALPSYGGHTLTPEISKKLDYQRDISPISIPPSHSAYARSIEVGSAESLVAQSPLVQSVQGQVMTPAKENPYEQHLLVSQPATPREVGEESRSKPRRKPPPDLVSLTSYSGASMASSTVGDEDISDIDTASRTLGGDTTSKLMSSSPSVSNEDYYYSSSDALASSSSEHQGNDNNLAAIITSTRFPQFPDINKSKKKDQKGLFLLAPKKHKSKKMTAAISNESEEDDNYSNDEDIFRRPTTPVLSHPNQGVRLKTTMRKTNKRKEKKYMFNENKPWKNHNGLSVITDQERKRYEGVWVSNKGNYIKSVVTRLIGVDYENVGVDNEVEEEISRKAARLSSTGKNFDSAKFSDQENFHNLLNVEVDQLIHGVVVRRIWKRSRLPKETLGEIWNLVDFRKDGTLNKHEFVVGMWLVDQCLYGRKLPKKVDNEVWDSLGSIGLNVSLKKKGKR